MPDKSDQGTPPPARYFVWGVAGIWAVVAVLTHTGLLSAEVVERHALGGAEGLLPLQLMSYPFLTHPDMSPLWTAILLAFSTAWLLGMAENASDWLDGWGFTRLYSLATIGVGSLCWLAGRELAAEPAVVYGAYPVLGVMIGAVTAYDPARVGYPWGDTVREWLSNSSKGAVLWWVMISAAAYYVIGAAWRLFHLSAGVRGILLPAFLLFWVVWPLLAFKRMAMRSVCAWWCLWRGVAAVNSGLWLGAFPLAQLIDIGLPLLVGIVYGLIARRIHRRS